MNLLLRINGNDKSIEFTILSDCALAFKESISASSRRNRSNIVLALDLPPKDSKTLLRKSLKLLDSVHPYLCAVKVNRHLTLPLGPSGVEEIVSRVHKYNLPAIMDCKINDIGSTNATIAEYYFRVGFDALTANPFVGWTGGLEPVFKVARKRDCGVILLVYMSHAGAREGYGQPVYNPETGEKEFQYILFAKKALAWKADGVVVGATYPEKIREVAEVLEGEIPIYSPGVGVQGGNVVDALEAGATYLIVGRAIVNTESPVESAKVIRDTAWSSLKI